MRASMIQFALWLKGTFLSFPMYILGRPFKGFDDMKTEKKGSLFFAFSLLVFSSLLNILEYVYSGFLVNRNNPYLINSLYLIMVTLFPIALFVVGNWSVTTLLDGKGRMNDIFMVTMYAMYPFVITRIISLLLSRVLSMDEMPIANTLSGIGSFMFIMYGFIGLIVVHEYSFSRALASVLLTIVAMMVIVFVLMLLFALATDVFDFVRVLSKELILKYF